jgi:hypothetical protein
MNWLRASLTPPRARFLTATVFLLLAAAAPAQDDGAATKTHVSALRHARAGEVAKVLRDLYRDRAEITFSVDERTNTLLVAARPGLVEEVVKLLIVLDDNAGRVVDENREVYIFRLDRIRPDQKLVEALQVLLPKGKEARFVVDAERKLLMVQGPPALQRMVEALLRQIEIESTPAAAGKGLQVRLLWLVGGKLAQGEAVMPAGTFPDVAEDLKKLAMHSMRMAAHTLVHVTPGAAFTVSGGATLDGPYAVKLSGKAATAPDGMVELDVTALVMPASGGSSARLCELRTELRVPLGRMVVIGAAPLRGEPTAFVIHVTEAASTKAPAKKAAASVNP